MAYQEREAKFYIQDLNALAEKVRMTGADLVQPRVLERNLRLDTPDGSLQREARILRIRMDDRVHVTYKEGARNDNGIITRTEIEVQTDDYEATRRLFEALGFVEVVIYEKYRQIYQLGDVAVMLDELPFGDFVEIEAPNNVLIEGVVQMLGLDGAAMIPTNYLGLFGHLKRKKALDVTDLTFENFVNLAITAEDLGVQPADS